MRETTITIVTQTYIEEQKCETALGFETKRKRLTETFLVLSYADTITALKIMLKRCKKKRFLTAVLIEIFPQGFMRKYDNLNRDLRGTVN